MSRKRTVSVKCTHPGCGEYAHYEYDNLRDARRSAESHRTWKCTRHYAPDDVLSLTNLTRTTRLVSRRGEGIIADHLFWEGRNGFASGDGYKAWTKDFPEGAVLEVTARIILPTEKP